MTSVTRTLRNRTYALVSIAAVIAVVGGLSSAPAQAVGASSNDVTTTSQDNGYSIFNRSDQSLSLKEVRQKSRGQAIKKIGTNCEKGHYSCTWGEGFGTSPQGSIAAQSGQVTGVGYFDIPASSSLDGGTSDDGTDVVYITSSGTEVTFSARTEFTWLFGIIPWFQEDPSACFVVASDPEAPAIGCEVKSSRGVGTQTEFTIVNIK